MMLLLMHQPHHHQPWRLDRCNPFIHSLCTFDLDHIKVHYVSHISFFFPRD